MTGDGDEFDFGTAELNDPEYESKVGGDSVTTADTPTAPAQPSATPASGNAAGTQGQPADSGKPATGGAGDADKATAPDGQQPVRGGTRDDGKGNLVDRDGNIIAAAGAERRHFERAQQQSRYIARLEGELAEARTGASMTGVLNGLPAQLGLDARETEMGMQVMSSFKKDPVATARWALQETMRMGYTLAQVVGEAAQGQPLGGSLDLQAVRAMIGEAVAPLVGDRQAQQQRATAQASAQRDYEAFVAKHDHAAVHDQVLASMLQNDRTLTPEVAYWQLREYAAKNGLDFAQPLRAQVLARQNGQQQAAPNGGVPQHANNGPMAMPNGANPTADMRTEPELAAPDASWDSIVQQSLRSAGYH